MKYTVADLHLAIRGNQVAIVESILAADGDRVDVNKPMRGVTALSLAIASHSAIIVDHLLKHPATDATKPSRVGPNDRVEPPLFTACRLGQLRTVRKLLDCIGWPAGLLQEDFFGHSPLWISVRECHLDIVQLLLDMGAARLPNKHSDKCPLYLITRCRSLLANPRWRTMARLLVREGVYLDAADGRGRTPLYAAAKHGDSELVELLLRAGANANNVAISHDPIVEKCREDWRVRLPRRLLDASVLAIRRRLSVCSPNTGLIGRIQALNLPSALIDTLSMKH